MPENNFKKKGGKKKKPLTTPEMVSVDTENPNERDVKVENREKYFAFIRWDILTLAEKKKEKAPKTQAEFSKQHGISEVTLSNWRARAEFQKLRSEMFRKKLAAEVPEVMADMRKRIKKIGKADEVELWLAYSEGWDKRRVIEIKPPVEFGEGDVRQLIAKLPEEKQKQYYVTIAKLLAEAQAANDDVEL